MKKVFMIFNIVYLCSSCDGSSPGGGQTTSAPDPASTSSSPIVNVPDDTSLYSIHLSENSTLSLQQWDSTIDLQSQLGKPLKQKIRELDRNSDTFSGSFIKDLEYDGLKLQLFSPPQNGKTYWIQQIILTNTKYKTTKGITIGDEWEHVRRAYPSIQKFPGVNENMYYVADAGYEKSIEMEFENNKLKKLRMYYTIN
ncbi:MAG TPA: hypothetical protein VFP97_01385 [Chitinophagaceae bacterium]|nr:hypothetical protein [Chitinophagaceae bacterium]